MEDPALFRNYLYQFSLTNLNNSLKDFDTGNVLGPFIVTADEIDHPVALKMEARVNGQKWGGGNSKEMHHSFADMIVHISDSETIYEGENNNFIILGRDRPSEPKTGYGGRGDSHTSTHGAFAALAFGIGTSEVEHVLATQCLPVSYTHLTLPTNREV